MSKKLSKKQVSGLYHYAENFIDLNKLFRAGKPKIKELNRYKINKIRRAVETMFDRAGGKVHLERDFIKLPKTTRLAKYNEATGMPKYSAGVMINGGKLVNHKVRIGKDLTIKYDRGLYEATSAPLNAKTAKTLEKSIEKHRKRIEREDYTYIGSNGNYITPAFKEGHNPTDLVISKSLHLLEKYNGMAQRGEKRENGRLAATMDKWGFSLLWENKKK